MTAPPAGALEACLALLEKATPGEWAINPMDIPHEGNSIFAPTLPSGQRRLIATTSTGMDSIYNRAAIAAAVNLLKDHGPALLAALRLREGCEGLVRYDVAPDLVQTPYGPGLTINRYEEPDGEYVRADDLARILEQTK